MSFPRDAAPYRSVRRVCFLHSGPHVFYPQRFAVAVVIEEVCLVFSGNCVGADTSAATPSPLWLRRRCGAVHVFFGEVLMEKKTQRGQKQFFFLPFSASHLLRLLLPYEMSQTLL